MVIAGITIRKPEYPLREEVYRALRRAILRGELVAGTRLVETALAHELRISRTPVREAIHKLELEGLVKPSGRRGVSVVGLDPQDVREIMELRVVLESHAAGLAAGRASADDIAAMAVSLDRAGQSIETHDLDSLLDANTNFHDTIVRASGSRRLGELISRLREYVLAYRELTLRLPGVAERSHEEHLAILRAITGREQESSKALMTAHLKKKMDHLVTHLRTVYHDA